MKKLIYLEIPDGTCCENCILLEAGCSSVYDYCRLFPKDRAKNKNGSILKHNNCPSLRKTMVAKPIVS